MKWLLKVLLILFGFIALIQPCRAEEDIFDILPEEVRDQFENVDLQSENPKSLLGFISFQSVLDWVTSSIKKVLPEFTQLILCITGYIFLFTLLDRLSLTDRSNTVKFIIKSVINAVLLLYLFGYFSKCCALVEDNLESIQIFCKATVPIMTALLIQSGKSFSATLFSYAVSLTSVLLTALSSNVLMPLVHIFISVGSCGFLWDDLHFSAITDLIKKFIKWLTGAVFSIFTFSLSIQSMLSKSADNIARKALKAAAGSIPMMGSVLSQGLDGTFTLLNGTKTAVSTVGISAIVMIFIGTAVVLLLQYFALSIGFSVSQLFNQKDCLSILKVIKEAYLILLNLFLVSVLMCVICFLIMCIGAN